MKKPPTLLVSTQDNWSILIILCQVRGLFLVTLLLRELNFQMEKVRTVLVSLKMKGEMQLTWLLMSQMGLPRILKPVPLAAFLAFCGLIAALLKKINQRQHSTYLFSQNILKLTME